MKQWLRKVILIWVRRDEHHPGSSFWYILQWTRSPRPSPRIVYTCWSKNKQTNKKGLKSPTGWVEGSSPSKEKELFLGLSRWKGGRWSPSSGKDGAGTRRQSFIQLLEVSRDKDVRLDSSAGTRDESKVPPEEKRKSGSFIYLLFFCNK